MNTSTISRDERRNGDPVEPPVRPPAERAVTTMTAVARKRFGSPDVMTVQRIERPRLGDGDVLVEVAAAGVNRGDALELRGWPYLARLMGYGLVRPNHAVLGTDIAGRVVATRGDVGDIAIGDDVIGIGTGAFAELATIPSSVVVRRPRRLDATAAASIPTTGITALQAIRDAGRVVAGQHVAVIGASGGVGTFAVQIAKTVGAEVTGVAGARNLELVRAIGADHVVDYRDDDLSTHVGRYDVIVDTVGSRPLRHLRRALTGRGTLVVVGGPNPQSLTGMRRFVAAVAMSPLTSRRLVPLFSKPDRADLVTLVDLAERGAIRPVVGRTVRLGETAEALRQVETGHGTGRTVITVSGTADTQSAVTALEHVDPMVTSTGLK